MYGDSVPSAGSDCLRYRIIIISSSSVPPLLQQIAKGGESNLHPSHHSSFSTPLQTSSSLATLEQSVFIHSFIHSFILNSYIAPLQENYSEAQLLRV